MSWIGAGIGAFLGAQRGGLLGGLVGAVVGNWIAEKVKSIQKGGASGQEADRETQGGELATLAAIAAILSKMAKADGLITADEVRYCEQLFDRMNLHGEKREYCIRVFRAAKNDAHSIYDYAASFADAQRSKSVREVVYHVLWDLAGTDGVISPEELEILRRIVPYLRLSSSNFSWECNRRGIAAGGGATQDAQDPYEVLGCARSASDDEVRRAYRERAKQLHPDALRAQGLSDELIRNANDQMARLNAAWSIVRQERNL